MTKTLVSFLNIKTFDERVKKGVLRKTCCGKKVSGYTLNVQLILLSVFCKFTFFTFLLSDGTSHLPATLEIGILGFMFCLKV